MKERVLTEQQLEKIESLISRMTLKEKTGMIHADNVYDTLGVEHLGIPPFHFSDGPMGVRGEFNRETCNYIRNTDDLVTSFPCPTSVAATWNPELARENGSALGKEVRGRGKDVSLSPGINIHRTPLGGRSFEYLAEDPHLISKIVVPMIQGIQENDVAACIKHFVANNQETRRMDVNTEVDERALQELYLPGFHAAVTEGKVMTLMGAYNQFRGEYCCQNTALMQDLLRKQWGFEGLVISDWGAVHDTKKALAAGVDFDMDVDNHYDDYHYADPLIRMVENGEVPEEAVDNIVRRILKLMFRLGIFDEDRNPGCFNVPETQNATLHVARESIVLLKNDRKVLPLARDPKKTVAVIGDNANRQHAFAGGSSEVRALFEITPLLALQMHLGGNFRVKFAQGYTAENVSGEERTRLREEALTLARKADQVIYIGGLNHTFDMENRDMTDLKLPYGQDALISELLDVNPDTVVVNLSGSPVEMGAWLEKASAVVQYWYSGSKGALALAEVLYGDVNPSGKLPTTFPKKLEDTPAEKFGEFPGGDTVHYNEGIYVGYRYYDTYRVEPEFCFGHGLSYTEFAYSDLKIEKTGDEDVLVRVSLKLRNAGDVAGRETVQLYISDVESSVDRPMQELKGFGKVFLEPGGEKEISFDLKAGDFSFYSVEESGWKLEPGAFEIRVGSSSRDIRLTGTVEL